MDSFLWKRDYELIMLETGVHLRLALHDHDVVLHVRLALYDHNGRGPWAFWCFQKLLHIWSWWESVLLCINETDMYVWLPLLIVCVCMDCGISVKKVSANFTILIVWAKPVICACDNITTGILWKVSTSLVYHHVPNFLVHEELLQKIRAL